MDSTQKPRIIGIMQEQSYPLSSYIYGHRFMQGQDYREYLLEFLNVVVGQKYSFVDKTDLGKWPYDINKKTGLRRFVFYASEYKNQSRYTGDEFALKKMEQTLINENYIVNGKPEQIRELFRSYLAIEEDRSWYAKSFFPVHKELLFGEALRKNASKRKYQEGEDPDDGITFTDRNFFARGGELYYLMIVSGSLHDNKLSSRIIERLKDLLENHHQPIGKMAEIIENAWQKTRESIFQGTDLEESRLQQIQNIGWLPDRDCDLFKQMANELDALLSNDLNQMEMLHLLNHLICLHVMQYIYRRSQTTCNLHQCCIIKSNKFLHCRPILLIDAIESKKEGSSIRNLSARLYRQLDDKQIEKARIFILEKLISWGNEVTEVKAFREKIMNYFNLGYRKTKKDKVDSQMDRFFKTFSFSSEDIGKALEPLRDIIFENYSDNLAKHALGVHRKLAKQTGMLQPKTSAYQRWTMPNHTLKTLVLSILKPGENMTIDEFTYELWQRYGLVIGPKEADDSGLSNEPIDRYHFEKNLQRFQEKLLNAGLALQYSDATCLVQNKFPRFSYKEEVLSI